MIMAIIHSFFSSKHYMHSIITLNLNYLNNKGCDGTKETHELSCFQLFVLIHSSGLAGSTSWMLCKHRRALNLLEMQAIAISSYVKTK